jgi:hypothetical protein
MTTFPRFFDLTNRVNRDEVCLPLKYPRVEIVAPSVTTSEATRPAMLLQSPRDDFLYPPELHRSALVGHIWNLTLPFVGQVQRWRANLLRNFKRR